MSQVKTTNINRVTFTNKAVESPRKLSPRKRSPRKQRFLNPLIFANNDPDEFYLRNKVSWRHKI